jgi:hypothetical protein
MIFSKGIRDNDLFNLPERIEVVWEIAANIDGGPATLILGIFDGTPDFSSVILKVKLFFKGPLFVFVRLIYSMLMRKFLLNYFFFPE